MLKNINFFFFTQPFLTLKLIMNHLDRNVKFQVCTKKVVENAKNDLKTTCYLTWKNLFPTWSDMELIRI